MFIFIVILAGAAGCGAPGVDQQAATVTPTTPSTMTPMSAATPTTETLAETDGVPFTTVAQDAPLGDQPAEPAYVVVTAPDTWSDVQDQLPSDAVDAGRDAAATNESVVIVAFAGAKATSGYGISIESIRHDGDRLIVTVTERTPDEDAIVEPAMTLPFHVVRISADELPDSVMSVVFQDKTGSTLAQQAY